MASPTLDDLMYAYYSSVVPATTQAMFTGSAGVLPSGSATPNVYTGSSTQVTGLLTAPGADVQIIASAALTGLYEISVYTNYGGSGTPAAAAETNNMIFRTNVTNRFRCLIAPVAFAQGQKMSAVYRLAAETISVRSVLAATANVDYWAVMIATKLAD